MALKTPDISTPEALLDQDFKELNISDDTKITEKPKLSEEDTPESLTDTTDGKENQTQETPKVNQRHEKEIEEELNVSTPIVQKQTIEIEKPNILKKDSSGTGQKVKLVKKSKKKEVTPLSQEDTQIDSIREAKDVEPNIEKSKEIDKEQSVGIEKVEMIEEYADGEMKEKTENEVSKESTKRDDSESVIKEDKKGKSKETKCPKRNEKPKEEEMKKCEERSNETEYQMKESEVMERILNKNELTEEKKEEQTEDVQFKEDTDATHTLTQKEEKEQQSLSEQQISTTTPADVIKKKKKKQVKKINVNEEQPKSGEKVEETMANNAKPLIKEEPEATEKFENKTIPSEDQHKGNEEVDKKQEKDNILKNRKKRKIKSNEQKDENEDLLTESIPSEETTETEPLFSQVVKAAKKIEGAIKYSSVDVADEFLDEIFADESLQSGQIQAGLVKMSQHFFPTAVMHQIIPDEILESENFEKKCGTFLMKKIIRQTALTVDDVAKYCHAEDFTPEQLETTEKLILSFHPQQSILSQPSEEVCSEIFRPFMTGLQVIKSMVEQDYDQVATKEVFNYLEMARYQNFSSPSVQMAYLKLAKRISNPVDVKSIIHEEVVNQPAQENKLIGFKVLTKVLLKDHFLVSNLQSFWMPEDFTEDACRLEKAQLEHIVEERSLIVPEEQVFHSDDNNQLVSKEIASCLSELQNSRNVDEETPYSTLVKYPSLDNIPAQAALLGIAANVSSVSQLHQTIALELVKENNILPVIGSIAVINIFGNKALEREEILGLNQENILHQMSKSENLALWENIASFVQSENVPAELLTVDDESLKDLHRSALNKVCKQLRLANEISQEDVLEGHSKFVRDLKGLEAQIVMSEVAENILHAPVIEDMLNLETPQDQSYCLPHFGFKALKTAIESVPVSVESSDFASYLDIQDLDQDTVQRKVALVLNTALTRRFQVLFVLCRNLVFDCVF